MLPRSSSRSSLQLHRYPSNILLHRDIENEIPRAFRGYGPVHCSGRHISLSGFVVKGLTLLDLAKVLDVHYVPAEPIPVLLIQPSKNVVPAPDREFNRYRFPRFNVKRPRDDRVLNHKPDWQT